MSQWLIHFGFMQQLSGLNIKPSGLLVSNGQCVALTLFSWLMVIHPLNCRCWHRLRYDVCLPYDLRWQKYILCKEISFCKYSGQGQTNWAPTDYATEFYTPFFSTSDPVPAYVETMGAQGREQLFGFVMLSIHLCEPRLPYRPNHESHALAFSRLHNSSLLITDSTSWVAPVRD